MSARRWLSPAMMGTLVAAALLFGGGVPARAGIIDELPFQSAYGVSPVEIAAGPDGALWFTLTNAPYGSIGRMTTSGVFTEFPIPTALSNPRQITRGPDGALWFTQAGSNRIGRITTTGNITEFPIATADSWPLGGITTGPDGALWFTEGVGNRIGRITPAGVITEFPIPTANSGPGGITVGPDGALWFTEYQGNQIGRITTGGVITEFPIPTADSGPGGIAAGPDGALWFTEYQGNQIGRITTAGVISEFPIPTAGGGPLRIAAGPDGALWFTEFDGGKIGRLRSSTTFVDVPAAHPLLSWVEELVAAGITSGCSATPPQYCPDAAVTRAQMAVFLLRAEHGAGYAPPGATGSMFADVPAGHPFGSWIEQLAREGITAGCASGPPRYCPDATVTRGQMAVFLLRAEHGAGYQPPAATGTMFADVPSNHPFATWIEQVVREGITSGCATSPSRYCPDATVTRAQMAVFLVRAFGL